MRVHVRARKRVRERERQTDRQTETERQMDVWADTWTPTWTRNKFDKGLPEFQSRQMRAWMLMNVKILTKASHKFELKPTSVQLELINACKSLKTC